MDKLRHVELTGTGYTLETWDTGRQGYHVGRYGKDIIGYRFKAPDGTVLFEGEDFGCAPGWAIDSDDCLRGILGFLTLKPGDTDAEYFADYTEDQMDFARDEAEYLQMWSMDDEETAEDYTFTDVE